MSAYYEKIRTGLFAASIAAVLVGFRAMLLSRLPSIFAAPEEDLSFGWYVPLFSLYVLWTERAKVRDSLGSPSLAGLMASVPFFLLGLLGARGLQIRFELLAFVGLMVTIPWTFFGLRTAKRVLFPALFLLFCMPLNSYLSLVTVHLRLLVSAVSTGILSGFGMDIAREGNLIALPGVVADGHVFTIDIADPCSGLRSIFALLALAAGYGYFTQPTWLRRGVLFALAVPFAVIGNILRIMTICIVARCFDTDFAIGFYHDFAGYVVFLVALALLVGAGGILSLVFDRQGEVGEKAAAPVAEPSDHARDRAPVLLPPIAFVLVAVVMACQTRTPRPEVAEPPVVVLPETLSVRLPHPIRIADEDRRPLVSLEEDELFNGEAIAPSVAETNLLVGATLSRRAYSPGRLASFDKTADDDGEKRRNLTLFSVSSVVSGPAKQSLHRPELCLPSQGFDMGDDRVVRVGSTDWHVIELMAKGGRGAALFAYTFFNQDGCSTHSHEVRILRDVWDRTVHNRVDRWAMITVHLNMPDEAVLRAVLESLESVVGKEKEE